jgi:hypothetical protein
MSLGWIWAMRPAILLVSWLSLWRVALVALRLLLSVMRAIIALTSIALLATAAIVVAA